MKTKLLHPIARLLLAILMCLPICGSHAFAQEAESYAVFDEATNTLTFKRDNNKPAGAFALNEGDNAPGWYKPDDDRDNTNIIKKVIFDASFANARPTSCYNWFFGCRYLTTIEGIEYLNTENVTNMGWMFSNCEALTILDVSKFDTKNVTDMSFMFNDCSALTTLDVSNFDTKNVTDMSGMFCDCSALTTLDIANFDTKNVTNMRGMFYGCRALTTLDVSKFDTKNVTDMNYMFYQCSVLTTLDVSNFDTQNVTDMSNMFNQCSALTTLDVSNFDTQNVTNMSWMFSNNFALTTLNVSNFDTQNVTNMSNMFAVCKALTTIYASDKFVTTACKEDRNMFTSCDNLVGAVPYDENKVGKEMANYTNGYFTDIASKVAESYAVFDEATNTLTFKHDTNKPTGAFALNEGDNAPGWYKSNDDGSNANIIKKVVFDASFANARPTNCHLWFYGCKNLTTIEGIEYLNTENVTSMSLMFSGCSALTTLNLSNFDTQSVTNMTGMFSDCRALTTLDVSNFNTQNVTDMSFMFFNCSAITTLDIAKFDTKNVTDMSLMFSYDTALTTIYASDKFVTTACEKDENMFAECANLVGAVPYDENKVGKKMANYTTGYFTDIASKVAESYAVFDEATNTLTFKHDTKKTYGAFALNEGDNAPGWNDESNANIIKKVVFDASFANARPTSCYRWFDGCDKLTTIEGIEYLNTENVTNMSLMFSNCWILTTLDVSKFDTKNVTDMIGMFSSCEALTTLDVSNFDTQNVTDMSDMFNGCKALTTLDVSNFDTKNVTDMSGMFWVCAALTTLDVSHFDTQNVTNMNGMFCDCSALTTLDVSNFDTKNVTNMNYMFSGCKALTTLDVSNFDTKNVTNMSDMFSDCPALTTIYASEKFVTTACEVDENMFADCTNLMGAVPYDENKVGKEMANYTNGYFTDKAATGIDAPTVSDDTAAEYYDLQGRRLNAPQKGVNIVKRGKKTTKMLVK